MPEMSKAFTPKYMGDEKPREKILKLGRKITDCIDHKIKGLTTNDFRSTASVRELKRWSHN